MTPAARISAAIDLMDRINDGALADRAFAEWGRKNRYAGSKDRAAIGDILYDVLRQKQTCAARGGGQTGRALLLGYLRVNGQDPAAVFGADRYAPAALRDDELAAKPSAQNIDTDFPVWLWPEMQRTHGDQAQAVALALRARAPVHLRVNLMKLSREQAIATLADAGVVTKPHPLSPSALEVVEGPRKIRNSSAYLSGDVELQDASSQAVADLVPLQDGESLLDYCAGAGGKSLAVAGRTKANFFAHDIEPRRMKDLPARAERAEVQITQLAPEDMAKGTLFDTVLVDAPCSGSGSWRRDPQGKWLFTADKLDDVLKAQADILDQAATLVKPQGHLVYATCSVLACENGDQVQAFLNRTTGFGITHKQQFTPLSGSDGFYCAVLCKG